MTGFEIALALYLGLVTPLAGFLLAGRFKRIEDEISELKTEMRPLRVDINEGDAALRTEIAALRADMNDGLASLRAEMRAEIAGLRSDLTQVALAIGARLPRASEG